MQDLSRPRATLLLQTYARQVVARDVVERHDVGSPRVATIFSQMVLGANARPLSLRKSANDLKSRGVPIGRATLSQMLEWFEEAFLIGRIREHSRMAAETNEGIVGDALLGEGEALYQVTHSLDDPKTRRREFRALEEAMCEQDLPMGTIIVQEGERETIALDGGRTIEVIPAWRWFLEGGTTS